VSETLEVAVRHRGQLAEFGSNVMWRVVGVAVGVIGYAAEAGGFELEMRRVAARSRAAGGRCR
jgi:hypothetical protein